MPWRMPEMVAPRTLVFQPLVEGNEALGTRLDRGEKFALFAHTCFQVNRHTVLLFGKRLDTHFTSSDTLIIGFIAELFFFCSGKRIYFFWIHCRIRRMRVDGSRIGKEEVAYSKISGYMLGTRDKPKNACVGG